MKYLLKKINKKLLIILFLAVLLRFGGLNWCLPHTPHPDEWNMAAAVTRLNWENKLNPQFFAYGQFPLYLTYFSARIYNFIPWINIKEIDIQEAVFFLRFWAATAGVGTVYLVYLISKRILTTHYSLLASILAAFTPGLIQIAHFGTTESLLSFFFLLIIYLSFKILEKAKARIFVFLGIVLGLSLATKISALIFTIPILMVIIFLLQRILMKPGKRTKGSFLLLCNSLVAFATSLVFTLITSPYLLLAYHESKRTLLYETAVAAGNTPVFYTRQFINTTPVLFQLQKVFPYALGWPILILGTLGIFLSLFLLIKPDKNKKTTLNLFASGKEIFSKAEHFKLQFLTLNFALLTYFFSQAFLFCKWTRFMAPIFAFFPIFAAILLSYLGNLRYLKFLLVVSCLPGLIFSSIYFQSDIRFAASDWIYQNIPSNSQILFDTGNVVDIPISPPNHPNTPNFPNYRLTSFDFYHLDENYELLPKLLNYLETSDYIIIPSRRIFANHLRLADKYPLTAKYYSLLFSGKLGFTEIKTFVPLASKVLGDEKAEETFTVFDHPTIRIYQKVVPLGQNDYENLFQYQ